jgi:1,4-alpha-glucan branching enzyme
MPPLNRVFTKPVVFRLNALQAHHVSLVIHSAKGGTSTTRTMHKGVDHVWHITIELPRGRYLYRFFVDHVPTLDPASRGTVHDDHHVAYSMREVGH